MSLEKMSLEKSPYTPQLYCCISHQVGELQMAYSHTAHMSLLYPLLYITATDQLTRVKSGNRGSVNSSTTLASDLLDAMSPPVVSRGRRFPCTPGLEVLQQYH